LKEDGFLVYSTCSYSREENEDILDFIFNQYSCRTIELTPDPSWNIIETKSHLANAFGYRFYPDRLAGEGFFLAVIQKKEPAAFKKIDQYANANSLRSAYKKKGEKNSSEISRSSLHQIETWVKQDQLQYVSIEGSIHGLTPAIVNDFEFLRNKLYLKKAGIRMGKEGEKEWIPDHELALSDFLRNESPSIEVSKSDALVFLRGNSFDIPSRGKGWHTLCFQGERLGWVKLLDIRMNNYYPKSWRIRQ
jgi:NOL1/NOP2/fmu family ribosome biogenesis protein